MKKYRSIFLSLLLILVLAACNGAETMDDSPSAAGEMMADENRMDEAGDDMKDDDMMDGGDNMMDDDSMMDDGGDDMMDGDEMMSAGGEMTNEGMGEEQMEGEHDEMMESDDEMASAMLPAWQQLPLVDARTGESFTLADFAGKTVFVEPMATWCTNCRRQLDNVAQAKEMVPDDGVVFLALSVETTLGAQQLAQYADDAGFDWTFAVLTPELLQELVDAFGRAASNPPATPHFIIRPDGTTTALVTGIDGPSDLVAQIEEARR